MTNHLIPLTAAAAADEEITVYVKGFLARGESPESFDHWIAGHRGLVESLGWSRSAQGYHWESGQLQKLALPVAAGAKVVWDVYRLVRHARRITPLATAGWFLAEQGAALSVRFVGQFIQARRQASVRAEDLARCLASLATRHRRVRVVAHSLGCRQVIEAAAQLPNSRRPHEIHLLAPACLEGEVRDKLPHLAREQSFVYFTHLDHVLDISFRVMSLARAIGAAGLDAEYPGLRAFDVSEEFDFWVHTEYKNRFAYFAAPLGTPAA
ncbi:MAG: alpha/beta hydrolase [Deltaproteobacteria bacterium]|nr:alpha/beta hydrolase [Deltaproteobacteria bacterium]MBW2360621.1 alpha/beta hydrolase [Deltaproteobacteria bacterium]